MAPDHTRANEKYLESLESFEEFWSNPAFDMPNWYDENWEPSN